MGVGEAALALVGRDKLSQLRGVDAVAFTRQIAGLIVAP
jgi:hypothetical protein